jgi:hypothetical protein
MKTVIATLAIFLASLFFHQANAQIEIEAHSGAEEEIEALIAKKEEVKEEEKEKLKEEVAQINELLEERKIDSLEAETRKQEAAKKAALNIEDKLDIIDSQIALLERNEGKQFSLSLGVFHDDEEEEDSDPKSTQSGMTLAFGFNNAIAENQSLDDSPYKIGGSRFFEIGYEFNTRIADFIGVRYGLSFQFNGLKPENNQYFTEEGDKTLLKEYPISLEKSKFRNDNLVLPIHLELKPFGADKNYFDENRFKIGLGGYLGFNLNSVQKLKFEENGDNQKIKLKEGYHTSNFIYGLSAYIGYDIYALYLKYDLNPIFTDNLVEERNVSLGVRVAF